MTKEIQESDKQDTDTSAQQSTHQYHSQPLENQESMNSSISQADRGSDSFMSVSIVSPFIVRLYLFSNFLQFDYG